jgi:photosystem II stability/assembly factor-like uncharacterized protein
MLRSSLLALLVLTSTSETRAQTTAPEWELLTESPFASGRFDDVTFATPDTGWVAELSGHIWYTSDGGDSWQLQFAPPERPAFRSLGVADARKAWAGTLSPEGLLYETRDGGETWQNITDRITGTRPIGICGMWAVNENTAYGVGAYYGSATLIRTYDGGQTWEGIPVASKSVKTLIDVYFFDEMNGIAVGGTSATLQGEASIIRTWDGGDTWYEVHRTTRDDGIHGEWGWKISFPTENVGYVSVEYTGSSESRPAKVLKTVDGGSTWQTIRIPGSTARAGLQGIGFVTEDIGWAGGRGVTSVTTDGGATWAQLGQSGTSVSPDGIVNRFYTVNDTLSYAVGRRVYRLNLASGRMTGVESAEVPESFILRPVYPNPFTESATLEYELMQAGDVRIRIIDQLGRTVRSFPRRSLPPGPYLERWDGRTDAGTRAAPGAYFIIVDIGSAVETKQVVFLR